MDTKIQVVAASISEEGLIDSESLVNETFRYDEDTVRKLKAEWTNKGYEEADQETIADILYFAKSFPDTPMEEIKEKKVFGLRTVESFGDWSVEESNRFFSLYPLKAGHILPCPALEGENGRYEFNQTGVDAIKSELVRGKAVAASFMPDDSTP